MSGQLPSTTVVLSAESEASLRLIGHISYALHAIVAVGAVLPGAQQHPAVAAGGDDRPDQAWRCPGQLAAEPFPLANPQRAVRRHRLRRDDPLWILLVVPGWIAWGLISLWFLYRVLRGWLALNDRQPMPMDP